jgi:hypothetical protein
VHTDGGGFLGVHASDAVSNLPRSVSLPLSLVSGSCAGSFGKHGTLNTTDGFKLDLRYVFVCSTRTERQFTGPTATLD